MEDQPDEYGYGFGSGQRARKWGTERLRLAGSATESTEAGENAPGHVATPKLPPASGPEKLDREPEERITQGETRLPARHTRFPTRAV